MAHDAVLPDTPQSLSFAEFLERMKSPAASDLVRNIKQFIKTFEGKGPDPEGDSQRVQEFLISSEAAFRVHPMWSKSPGQHQQQAVEGLEKYLMTKLYTKVFAVSESDRERDEALSQRMQALSFVRAEHLDIPTEYRDHKAWTLAMEELHKLNNYKAPRDKVVCILNCCRVIDNLLRCGSQSGTNSIHGADDFLPVLVYVVIHGNPPQLASNLMYIERFRMHSRMTSESAYFFTQLYSAASFVETINSGSLTMPADEFMSHMISAGIADMPPQQPMLPTASMAQQTATLSDSAEPYRLQPQQSVVSASHPTAGGGVEGQPGATTSPQSMTQIPASRQQQKAQQGNAAEQHVAPAQSEAGGQTQGTPSHSQLLRSSNIAELEAEGAPLLLEMDGGALAARHPYLHAHASDLRVRDVSLLLATYKEVVLRYEALAAAILAKQTLLPLRPPLQSQTQPQTFSEPSPHFTAQQQRIPLSQPLSQEQLQPLLTQLPLATAQQPLPLSQAQVPQPLVLPQQRQQLQQDALALQPPQPMQPPTYEALQGSPRPQQMPILPASESLKLFSLNSPLAGSTTHQSPQEGEHNHQHPFGSVALPDLVPVRTALPTDIPAAATNVVSATDSAAAAMVDSASSPQFITGAAYGVGTPIVSSAATDPLPDRQHHPTVDMATAASPSDVQEDDDAVQLAELQAAMATEPLSSDDVDPAEATDSTVRLPDTYNTDDAAAAANLTDDAATDTSVAERNGNTFASAGAPAAARTINAEDKVAILSVTKAASHSDTVNDAEMQKSAPTNPANGLPNAIAGSAVSETTEEENLDGDSAADVATASVAGALDEPLQSTITSSPPETADGLPAAALPTEAATRLQSNDTQESGADAGELKNTVDGSSSDVGAQAANESRGTARVTSPSSAIPVSEAVSSPKAPNIEASPSTEADTLMPSPAAVTRNGPATADIVPHMPGHVESDVQVLALQGKDGSDTEKDSGSMFKGMDLADASAAVNDD